MPTVASPTELQSEFDEIASLMPRAPKLSSTDRWILGQLPVRRDAVLEIGCGTGDLTQHLADRFASVDAIDLSAGMIAEAARRNASKPNVRFDVADMFAWLDAHPSAYDCIVTVATLHHVDLGTALRSMQNALRPGGRILVVDLYDRSGWRYFFLNAVALPLLAVSELAKLLARRTSLRLKLAYREHAWRETYLTLDEVRRIANEILHDDLVVQGTLFWRYTLRYIKR